MTSWTGVDLVAPEQINLEDNLCRSHNRNLLGALVIVGESEADRELDLPSPSPDKCCLT